MYIIVRLRFVDIFNWLKSHYSQYQSGITLNETIKSLLMDKGVNLDGDLNFL